MELPNSEIERRISEHIHSQRYRTVMRMRLIDGLTYDQISEAIEMSPRYLRSLVRRLTDILKKA
jgi:DNA-directed RNA polymerase specialized sigma24 family protein